MKYQKPLILLLLLLSNLAIAQPYDSKSAVNYTVTWWNKLNPDYKVFESNGRIVPPNQLNDCANYASQVLRAGGFIDSKSNTLTRNDIRQWYHSSNTNDQSYSGTWVTASMLFDRFIKGYEDVQVVTGEENVINKLKAGDLIFWRAYDAKKRIFEDKAHHVSVVVWSGINKYGNRDLSISSHSNNRRDDSLRSILASYNGTETFTGIIINGKTTTPANIKKIQVTKSTFYRLPNIIPDKSIKTLANKTGAETSSILSAYTNTGYIVSVFGENLSGLEKINIDGFTCNPDTVQIGDGYFTEQCSSGNNAGNNKKVNIRDSFYDLDVDIPSEYQYISLYSPVIAPLPPTLSDLGAGSIRVSWQPVSGATGYELYREQTLIATLGAVTNYDDLYLTNDSQACYRVRAISNNVLSSYSGESCLKVSTQKCTGEWTSGQYGIGESESTSQYCTSGYTGSVNLSHTCKADGTWGTTSTQTTCNIIPPTTCMGEWSGIQYAIGNVEEQFMNTCPASTQGQVRSFHTCQTDSTWSPLAQSDNCTAYLATPTNLLVSSVSGGLQLVWSTVSGATSYNIYKNGDSSTVYSTVLTPPFIDTNVVDGQVYSYSISSYSTYNNANATSPPSAWSQKSYTSGQTGISAPSSLTASQFTDLYGRTAIQLAWSSVANADSYYIYRKGYANPNGNSELLAPVSGFDNLFNDLVQMNLVSGVSYCYYIRAVKGNTTSPDSPIACSLAP